MLEKNVTKLTFLVALMATLLLVAAGAVRAEAEQVMVDTTWEGWPDVPKVYNTAKTGATRLTVPMVELDTNTYEKKFWLSEKKLLSEPVKSVYPKVTGSGSIAYVVYSCRYASKWNVNTWRINRTYSADFGANWSGVYEIQETGGGNAGHPFPIIHNNHACIAHSADNPPGSWQQELLFRSEAINSFIMSDSVLIYQTSGSSSEGVGTANLLTVADTLFCLYIHYDDVNIIEVRKSDDLGGTWTLLTTNAGITAGRPLSFVQTDSVFGLIMGSPSDNEVAIIRSFDRGYNWVAEESVSSIDSIASQGPAAAGDGVSAIHAIWWDYKGVSGGWYGFPFYRRSLDNGDNWDEIKSLAAGPNTDYVDICADKDRVYAIYNDGRWGSPDFSIFLRYSHDQGASWAEEIQLTDEIDPARRPDIYGDGDLVHMVWEEQHYPEYIWGVYYMLGVWYTPGDVDLSNEIDIADLVYIVDWMFSGGAAPVAYDAAQMDGLGAVDIADLVYVVDYMFNNGPPPVGGEGL